MHEVKIRQNGPTINHCEILIDGVKPRGVKAFTIHGAVNEFTRLDLDLVCMETDYFGEAGVYLPEGTRETLIRFGWTPPAEGIDFGKAAN